MIQFNLLPDVKIEYIKTRYRKRMIMLISAIVSGTAFAFFIILFLFVRVNQTKYMRDLDKDIKSEVSQIQSTPDLDKILTIQNQLNSLSGLHDKKVVSSRLVDYLTQLTPNQATISDVDIDFDTNTMRIKGSSDNLVTVNKFADTLKFTDYKVNDEAGAQGKAFKDVVLQSFSIASKAQSNQGGVAYELSFAFDPIIFAQVKEVKEGNTSPVTLNVPKIISTRSETEKPADTLFAPQPIQPTTGGQ
jgi:hypothetical protein